MRRPGSEVGYALGQATLAGHMECAATGHSIGFELSIARRHGLAAGYAFRALELAYDLALEHARRAAALVGLVVVLVASSACVVDVETTGGAAPIGVCDCTGQETGAACGELGEGLCRAERCYLGCTEPGGCALCEARGTR